MKYKYDYRFTILQVIGTVLFGFVLFFLVNDISDQSGANSSLRPLVISLAAVVPALRSMLRLDKKNFVSILDENLLLQGFRYIGNEKAHDVYIKFEDISSVKAIVFPLYGLFYVKIKYVHSRHNIAITRYYADHVDFFSALCQKIQHANPEAEIDPRLIAYLEKNKTEQLDDLNLFQKQMRNNRIPFLLALLLVLLMAVLLFLRLPIINDLRTYDTQQELFETCLESEFTAIVEGEQTNLAIAVAQESVDMQFYSQQDNGWRTKRAKQVKSQHYLTFTATLYTVTDTDEVFLYIVFGNDFGTPLEVSDHLNSDFVKIQSPQRENFTAFAAALDEYTDNYCFTVNDQEFSLDVGILDEMLA